MIPCQKVCDCIYRLKLTFHEVIYIFGLHVHKCKNLLCLFTSLYLPKLYYPMNKRIMEGMVVRWLPCWTCNLEIRVWFLAVQENVFCASFFPVYLISCILTMYLNNYNLDVRQLIYYKYLWVWIEKGEITVIKRQDVDSH